MRNILIILLIAILAGAAMWWLPWWMIAIVSFLVAVFFKLGPMKAFLMGFAAIALLWLGIFLWRDIPNSHILSVRMAKLFGLPHYSLYMLVSIIIGGIIGGLAGWAGGLMNRAFR